MVTDTIVVKPGEPRGVLPPGTRLRAYEILSVLGQGSFGITYKARDTQLDREVAIKEYLPTALALREAGTLVVPRSTEHAAEFVWGRERFVEEARTLAKLGHAPSIVRVHDFLEDNGTAYTVMELAAGETLEQRLKREGRLAPAMVDRLLQPLLNGLDQVHAIGFLHRDIKPGNIIVDRRGAPTLIDFGASRSAVATRTGVLTAIFTPGYAAAEQFTAARQGPWTDIYGLSATVYQAITGNVPPSAFDRMLEDEYQPLARLRPPGFSPGLLRGIDAGLAVRVSDRPQSIDGWRHVFAGGAMPSGTDATARLAEARPAGEPPPWASPTPPAPRSSEAPPAASLQPAPVEPPLARAAGRTSGLGSQRLVWAGLAMALVLLAGAGVYIASANRSGTALQNMTVEELAKALEERRKADAFAAEKKQLEDEAAHRAEADAIAKQKADAELELARLQRQKAEDELAKLKAEMAAHQKEEVERQQSAAAAAQRALEEAQKNKAETELAVLRKADAEARQKAAATAAVQQAALEAAQKKAEAEMAARRQAEEEAQKKATAEADAKYRADEALAAAQAARQKADEEAQRRAAAEVAAKSKADTDAKARAEAEAAAAEKKAAEAVETALRLATSDRQRLQVALTALGFDTRGSDGSFGPRTREMVAAWQKAQGQSATGFVNAAQQSSLLGSAPAVAAVAKFDAEQKKAEDDKKKAEEEAKKKAEQEAKDKLAAVAPPPATPPAPAPATPPAPVSRGFEYKKLTLNNGGGRPCGQWFNFEMRIYPNKIEAQAWGWHSMTLDSAGKFDSGEYKSSGGVAYRITGSMTSREVFIENVTYLCKWKGSF